MTKKLSELIKNLKQVYTIVKIIDLSSCEQNNNLVSVLSDLKNYEFKENERLLVVVDKNLKKSYSNHPVDILTIFQQQVRYLNLSHYFIIVLSNIKSVKEDLNYLHKIYYSQESDPISQVIKY